MAIEGLAHASSPSGGRQPLTSAQQEAMAAIVAAVPPLLREAYGDDLLAVVLFGSVARGTPHAHSDSDWLVVLRQRGAEPRHDHRGCEEARRALAPELAAAAAMGLLSDPQFHLRSAAEPELGGPLFLDLCHDGRILHDPEGWAARFLARYRERLAAQGSVRVPWGEGWYWRLTPRVRPAEEVWF
ncbi:MAG: nucleotidyltransferase domain-containing protein [Cyanobacteriota bacterium]|jgi:predicted nucleotidyltransferase